jgi:hypothetical protein
MDEEVALLPSMQCSVLKTLCKGLREKFPSNHVARILRLVDTEGAFIALMTVGTISRGDQFETLVEGRVRAVHCMIVAIYVSFIRVASLRRRCNASSTGAIHLGTYCERVCHENGCLPSI